MKQSVSEISLNKSTVVHLRMTQLAQTTKAHLKQKSETQTWTRGLESSTSKHRGTLSRHKNSISSHQSRPSVIETENQFSVHISESIKAQTSQFFPFHRLPARTNSNFLLGNNSNRSRIFPPLLSNRPLTPSIFSRPVSHAHQVTREFYSTQVLIHVRAWMLKSGKETWGFEVS